ncbi:MAG: hypothetical protein JWM33_3841 [Caulobacteraceae bacterium]|nr:hypothetical protein [Caulobacteraceae bacterium]
MGNLLLVSSRVMPPPAVFVPPADDIDALVEQNCTENRIESAMRIRALTEISSLDTDTLLALARFLEDGDRHEALRDMMRRDESR